MLRIRTKIEKKLLNTEGDSVLSRDYSRSSDKQPTRVVHKKLGPLHYLIKDNDKIVKRHLDQLLKNNIKSSVTEDYDIVNNRPTKEES